MNQRHCSRTTRCLPIALMCGIMGPDALSSPLVIGHRGAALMAPENTLTSVAEAADKADLVEFDVRVSSDGHLVVLHDSTLGRTTDGTGAVADTPLAALQALDAGSWFAGEFSGEGLPTMAQTLDAILPQAVPLIERKAGTPEEYVNALQAMGISNQVVVQSFDWTFLDGVHALDPDIPLGALGTGILTETVVSNLHARGVSVLGWYRNRISATEVELVHDHDLALFVWTVNGPLIQDYIDMGVDGIITDDPALARQLVAANDVSNTGHI